MRAAALALVLAGVLASGPASAERLVTSLSSYRVSIASNFTGTELVLFGTVERDANTAARRGDYAVVVTASGPPESITIRRKGRVVGIWVNRASRSFIDVPSYLAVLSNQPIAAIADAQIRRRLQLGLADTTLPQQIGSDIADVHHEDAFRVAFLRLMTEKQLYRESEKGVTFLTPNLFRATIPLPADAPIGSYNVDVKLFADGTMIAREGIAFELFKAGVEQFVTTAARDHGFFYGIATAGMALFVGWLASVMFRRD
jgi:uncharacterized protein (TIGR02186 family)